MTQKPDIILVMSDEHSPMFSSSYGHPIVRTPNMDRLASHGATFDAAYCASPICVPSCMAFMTAQYPSRTEAWDNGSPLRSDIPTFAHVLQKQGYETVLIGKMHFIGPDQLHGFEKRLVEDSRVCGTWIEAPDWNDPDAPKDKARLRVTNSGSGTTAHVQQDRDALKAALDFLDDLTRKEADRRPVFLCVSFNAPHFPLIAPENFEEYWPDNVDMPDVTKEELDSQHPFHKRLRSYFDIADLDNTEILKARAAFYALTTWLDNMLGEILDKVEAVYEGSHEQPMVGYVSDHGEMAGEHGLWWKCCFFEEAVRIPMILRWPGYIPEAVRVKTPVTLMDLSVTFAEIAGAVDDPVASSFVEFANGENLLPFACGEEQPDRAIISEYLAHAAAQPIRMIRQAHWKYIWYFKEQNELYNLEVDPREKRNLASLPGYEQIAKNLRTLVLKNWDAAVLDSRVRESQRSRNLIAATESQGTFE